MPMMKLEMTTGIIFSGIDMCWTSRILVAALWEDVADGAAASVAVVDATAVEDVVLEGRLVPVAGLLLTPG